MASLSVHAEDAKSTGPFSEEAEAGIISVNGNSKSQSYLLKSLTGYQFDSYTAKLNGEYYKNLSKDYPTNLTTIDEKWVLGIKLDRNITEKLGAFIGQSAEKDTTINIIRRYNSDIGARYNIVKHEGYYTVGEVGYRYSTEEYDGNVKSEHFNLGRVYLESEKQWSPACSTKWWAEYLPNFDEPKDYNINSELSLTAALNTTFSLKTAYNVKYDNVPSGTYKTDSMFTTSLLAKF